MTPETFWSLARQSHPNLPEEPPAAWSFGATADQANVLLDLVLRGVKTSTASSLWDYEAKDDPLPTLGELAILLDGDGRPNALIQVQNVYVCPFNEVDESHVYAEGEGDRTLQYWREAHEQFWRNYSDNPRGFEPDMPVVCERFTVLFTVEG